MEKKAKHRKAKKVIAPVDGVKPAAKTRPSAEVPVPSPESGPRTIEEHLLHPGNLKGFRHLRAGGVFKHPPESTLTIRWEPKTVERVVSWLSAGDRKALAQLLEANPGLIGHPVVYSQLFHLGWLQRVPDEGNLEEGYSSPHEYVPPKGTRRAAADALQQLFEALGRGLFPGATVQVRPRKAKGRPRKYKERGSLLAECEGLEEKLAELSESSPAFFRVRAYQSRAALEERLADLVQELHLGSWRSERGETSRVPGEPEFDASGNINLHAYEYRIRQQRLPASVTRQIARDAIQKQNVSKRRLIYGLLAHYEHLTIDQIRGMIERA